MPVSSSMIATSATLTTAASPSPPLRQRANGITEDRARSVLIAANLPMKLWPYAVKYMARIHNLVSNSNFPDRVTPLEVWNRAIGYPNPVPNVAKLHQFGHVGYTHIPAQKRVRGDKFAPRAHKGHLVGMIGEHIYQMWIPELEEIIVTASVKFDSYSPRAQAPQDPTPSAPTHHITLPIQPLLQRLTRNDLVLNGPQDPLLHGPPGGDP
ncbi:hypothetical protein BDW02DRAFT_608322, partial [Decorospora gaudefroyi]